MVIQYAIHQKEGVDNVWNIYGIKDISHSNIIDHHMNKLGSKAIAINKERAGFVIIVFNQDKATSKRVEYNLMCGTERFLGDQPHCYLVVLLLVKV